LELHWTSEGTGEISALGLGAKSLLRSASKLSRFLAAGTCQPLNWWHATVEPPPNPARDRCGRSRAKADPWRLEMGFGFSSYRSLKLEDIAAVCNEAGASALPPAESPEFDYIVVGGTSLVSRVGADE
jgi:hypothetical protein